MRSSQGEPLPKLLNGAEQDVIIRKVLASHVEHRQHGDDCATCDLLRTYFAVSEWSGLVADDSTDAFANQLRDMLARMNEIGAKPQFEDMLIARAASRDGMLDERRERCALNGVSPSPCVRNTMRRSVRLILANIVSTRRS